MKLRIIVPVQKTPADIEIEREVIIIGEVTGFWGYTGSDTDDPYRVWGLNPNALTFSSEPDDFTSLQLKQRTKNGKFRLVGEYVFTDSDDDQIKDDASFEVSSVTEVRDFPSITS